MKKLKDKSYALRIDAQLVEPLQKLKKLNRRSLNAEINAALDAWVGPRGERIGEPQPLADRSAAPTDLTASADSEVVRTGKAQQPRASSAKKQKPRAKAQVTSSHQEEPAPVG